MLKLGWSRLARLEAGRAPVGRHPGLELYPRLHNLLGSEDLGIAANRECDWVGRAESITTRTVP
jgi:hypothetical protein